MLCSIQYHLQNGLTNNAAFYGDERKHIVSNGIYNELASKGWSTTMMQLNQSVTNLRNLYPFLRDCTLVKVIWFELLNIALCFTVQMGFKSSDSIITKGVKENFEVSGVYTLIISVIVYFIILRAVLMELFSTGN